MTQKSSSSKPLFKPNQPKTFASLFSPEYREERKLKNGIAENKARIAHLETQLKTAKKGDK